MERLVKERLVGAAVLMAAAIILIPEMLSGPDRAPQPSGSESAARSDVPIKTYTIDLSQSADAPVSATVVDDRAPPPEHISAQLPAEQPAVASQAKPETQETVAAGSSLSGAQSQPTAARESNAVPPGTEAPRAVVEPPTSTPPTEGSVASRPLASRSAAPISRGWVVQVGSFAREATAERMMKELRARGRDAFVMPVRSGGTTLYRVRIGPTSDRASAETVLREVKASAPGAAVVAHP